MTENQARRPIKARGSPMMQAAARSLAAAGVTPNAVSFLSMVFAAFAAVSLLAGVGAEGVSRWLWMGGVIAGCLGRLICNLIDGMIAVEGGKGGPTGAIWNEAPDRVSDTLVLVAAGYAAVTPDRGLIAAIPADALGWAAALGAMATAYVRGMGQALGQAPDWSGPMAKPQRMVVIMVAAAATAIAPLVNLTGEPLAYALALIVIGTALTVLRRLMGIAGRLKRDAA
jgi:phosphatidylglycerophosphate synthase